MVQAIFGFRETFDCAAAVQAGVVAQSLVFTSVGVHRMEAFLVSTGIVALAEMGDKTQLLALVLAARFKKPWPIVIGIFVATVANHAMAGALGAWVTTVVSPQTLRWLLGASFLLMAVWMLIPDKLEDDTDAKAPRLGVFATTVVVFFLAEMGDKTQIATVMLAAKYEAYAAVVAGTTLGMMLANAPVVWLGERITRLVPLRIVHIVSALVFAALGLLAFVVAP
jgi:Ca2+/H+ antiporter, TMEM165/GDT1 family